MDTLKVDDLDDVTKEQMEHYIKSVDVAIESVEAMLDGMRPDYDRVQEEGGSQDDIDMTAMYDVFSILLGCAKANREGMVIVMEEKGMSTGVVQGTDAKEKDEKE